MPEVSTYLYCVVDFSNNYLGEVKSINSHITSNESPYRIFLKEPGSSELMHYYSYAPLTYTKDATGSGFWVIVQQKNSLYSYKIDDNGLNPTPVVSTFPSNTIFTYYNSQFSDVGIKNASFRIVPDYNSLGKKLYSLEWSTNTSSGSLWSLHHFYSISFNDSTGVFTNYQSITVSNVGGFARAFEFSNDYQKVYFVKVKRTGEFDTVGTTDGEVRAYNLVNNQERTLYEYSNSALISSGLNQIQKDKYGNLLLSGKSSNLDRDKYLHKIDNPDSYSNSSVVFNHINLNNNIAGYLPQTVVVPDGQCFPDIFLNSPEVLTNKLYKSSSTIETSNNYLVNTGQNIIFNAQDAVYLNPGTDIISGSYFIVEIVECAYGRSSSRKGNSQSENNDETSQNILSKTKLYPNPNNGTFDITLADGIKGDVSVNVVDITGKTVYVNTFNTSVVTINIPHLSSGIYMVRLSNGTTIETIKFIKE